MNNSIRFSALNFITLIFLLISCQQTTSSENANSKNELASNQLEASFIGCDCSPRFHSYEFKSNTGDTLTFDLEELKNPMSFICDKSFGQVPIINPYKNKKFILTFDKDVNNQVKNLIRLELQEKVNERYVFKSPLEGQYVLLVNDSVQSLIYSFRDYIDTTVISFIGNSSKEVNDYEQSLYFIENRSVLNNTDVNFWAYNPESDEYDMYVLFPRLEQSEKGDNTEPKSSSHNSNICNICGRDFYGKGYEEVTNGNWQPCKDPYQCFICSPQCGMKHTQKMNSYLEEASGVINGSCGLCRGTGVERSYNPFTDEITGRICPMCDGRGYTSY